MPVPSKWSAEQERIHERSPCDERGLRLFPVCKARNGMLTYL